MPKSAYADRFASGIALLNQIQDEQIGRLRSLSAKHRKPQIVEWVDLAASEAGIKERYRGRYLFELIQNAHDAITDQNKGERESANRDAHLVRLELTNRSLLVANFGQAFEERNVRALCRLHNTTKSVSKQIGHKGIGFKSVLEICQRPEVYSIGHLASYSFGFDGDQFRNQVAGVMGPDWNDDVHLPILRTPYFRNLKQLPVEERERIEELFDIGYVTVVRLPLDNSELVHRVGDDLRRDLQPSLLLFMPAISQIEVAWPDGAEQCFFRDERIADHPSLKDVILYQGDSESQQEDSRWLVLGPIDRTLTDRSLVQELGEAWKEVNALTFTLAFPLERVSGQVIPQQTSQPFYVYFKTHEFSGLRFSVQGDFHVRDDRKHLDAIPLNQWLAKEICAYLAGDGVELLKKRYPRSLELVDLLAPISYPESEFSRYFLSEYLKWLRISEFVPIDGGQYKAPEDCRFPPREADQALFREIFPASKLRQGEKWAYPIQTVVESERSRSRPFLLSSQLGGSEIDLATTASALQPDIMPTSENPKQLVAFMADWWANMPQEERRRFAQLLRTAPVFPSANGWLIPDATMAFQANLRADAEDITVPAGFDFSVLLRAAYPDEGIYSNAYRLFRELGAREYSARAVIQSALLPVLVDPQRFQGLQSKYPKSVVEAYQLLKDYFLRDGSTIDFQERLSRVPVPATNGREGEPIGWQAARECYFGASWPGGEILQQLYSSFDDSWFLADIPQLDIKDETSRNEWGGFFRWLGVLDHPRLNESESRPLTATSRNPFEGESGWPEYLSAHKEDFRCQNLRRSHGLTRRLREAHSIQHFTALTKRSDVKSSLGLYTLIARDWREVYRPHTRASLSCEYTTTGCPSQNIEDFLLFQLRNARWIPVQVGGQWAEPLAPTEIWLLGETDPSDVRSLVPTLPMELRSAIYQDLVADLGFTSSSTAQVEDYIRLLKILPERYAITGAVLTDEETTRYQKSLRAVFNWICDRIQTGLANRGEQTPELPKGLQVLAHRQNDLCYVDVSSHDLVYPDSSFLAERWKRHCAFLRINDDWRHLREWLGVPNLSKVVESRWQPGMTLTDETQRFEKRFSETIPYYLALIRQAQPANYDRILSRLQRLNVHIVGELTVREWTERLPDIKPIETAARVHLEKREDPNPRGGLPLRGGDLYALPEVLTNPDLLGEYIADYIEIARLGDAFVVLIERDTAEAKQRFLRSKGVPAEMVEEVMRDWGAEEVELSQPGRGELLARDLIAKVISEPWVPPPSAPVATETPGSTPTGDEGKSGGSAGSADSRPRYPDLALEKASGVSIAIEVEKQIHATGGAKPGAGIGMHGSVPAQEVTEELGRRGEKWAYEAERQRLAGLGLVPDELEEMGYLDWVSEKNKTANYDILTIWDKTRQERVFIEVKATTGDSPNIRMSLAEFRLALSAGEHYWLYWVAGVDKEQPELPVCYRNFARLVENEVVDLHVDTLSVTLPKMQRVAGAEGTGEF